MHVRPFVLLAMVGVSCAANTDAQGPFADPSLRAKLRDISLRVSAWNGVASPKTMLAVWSPDHQMAEETASGGSIIYDHAPVYVVEMTGGPFTAFAASPPRGAPIPQGDDLILTIDARTFDVTDVGIGDFLPDLTRIGPDVVNLLAEVDDASAVLSAVTGLNSAAQTQLSAAHASLVQVSGDASPTQRQRDAQTALTALTDANAGLTTTPSALTFSMGQGTLMF